MIKKSVLYVFLVLTVVAIASMPIGTHAASSESGKTSWKFDFGSGKVEPGYTQVLPTTAYTNGLGYGFESGAVILSVDRGGDEALRGDFCTSESPFLFSVKVPEGNYRVTVTMGDPKAEAIATVKAERRRLMLERVRTGAGQFATRSFMVNVRTPKISTGGQVQLNDREQDPATGAINTYSWDEKLTIGLSNAHPALAAVEIEKVDDVITLFITGDSTVTDQGRGGSWGQMAPRWFGPEVVVANHAESGETLKGFLKYRRWDKVLDSIKPGDYVLIEFGCNDSKSRGSQNMYAGLDFSETHSEAGTTYRELLKRFVTDVRSRGGNPLIASPSARRGEVANPSTLGQYAVAAMATAEELDVPGIDLNTMGMQMNTALGQDAGLQFADRTHHSEYGAYLQAKCIVLGMQQAKIPLAQFIVGDFGTFDPQNPKPKPGEFVLPVGTVPRDRGGNRGDSGPRGRTVQPPREN